MFAHFVACTPRMVRAIDGERRGVRYLCIGRVLSFGDRSYWIDERVSIFEDLLHPMNVLLIDDETEICFLLKNMLRRAGFECDMAHSMAEGREQLSVGAYQAVFLDIHLPDGLGYQLIPEIRETQPDVQVIAISAVDNEQKNAKDLGADLFIAKPFVKGSILDGLRSLGLTA